MICQEFKCENEFYDSEFVWIDEHWVCPDCYKMYCIVETSSNGHSVDCECKECMIKFDLLEKELMSAFERLKNMSYNRK